MLNLGILSPEYISHSKKIVFCNMTVIFFKVIFKCNLEKRFRNGMERKANHKSNNALDL